MLRKKELSILLILTLIISLFYGNIPYQTSEAKAAEALGETNVYKCQKYSDLDAIINDGTYTGITSTFLDPKQENFETKKNLSAVYKVILPEDGKIYAKYWVKSERKDNSFLSFTLYSDINLTNIAIKETECNYHDVTSNQFISLKKGTYYLEVKTDRLFGNEEINEKYGAYFGYVPKNIEFVSFIVSESKPTNKDVTVIINVNEDCETLWKKPEITKEYFLKSSTYWDTKDLLEAKDITFSENGDLTVRIMDVYGNAYMNSISVTNIDKVAPAKPSVKAYKANTSVVTGTAEKGSKVYAVIGNNTYKGAANSKTGTFSIRTAKLKSSTSIKVFCMDLAGNRSPQIIVKVK